MPSNLKNSGLKKIATSATLQLRNDSKHSVDSTTLRELLTDLLSPYTRGDMFECFDKDIHTILLLIAIVLPLERIAVFFYISFLLAKAMSSL